MTGAATDAATGALTGGDALTEGATATQSDAREERLDRIARLYGEITAATRAFLTAVAASDRHRDWAAEGFVSCAEWLAWRLGITRNTANEKVRAARALETLPRVSEAMARGELSFSKVRALTRVATPANEAELLELARAGSAANLERVVRSWRTVERWDEARLERARHRRRSFAIVPDEAGMYVVRGRLTPEVGALLMRAVEAAGDALFSAAAGQVDGEDGDHAPEPAQLRADALGLLAERALAAGFQGPEAPVSGCRAERYQVMLYVDEGKLRQEGDALPARRELEDGTPVTAETARRLSCDAAVAPLREGPDGSVLDVGRRRRTIPPALRRALETRDRGCRFPACGLRFTDAHHITHWADGGETSLDNTVLLCRGHHRAVHEGRVRVSSDRDGQVVFFTPGGRALAGAPPSPNLGPDPVEALEPQARSHARAVGRGAPLQPRRLHPVVRRGRGARGAGPVGPRGPGGRTDRRRGRVSGCQLPR